MLEHHMSLKEAADQAVYDDERNHGMTVASNTNTSNTIQRRFSDGAMGIVERNREAFLKIGLGETEPHETIVSAMRQATVTRPKTVWLEEEVEVTNKFGQVTSTKIVRKPVTVYEEVVDHDKRAKHALTVLQLRGEDPKQMVRIHVDSRGTSIVVGDVYQLIAERGENLQATDEEILESYNRAKKEELEGKYKQPDFIEANFEVVG